jgi:hypothetical protein
MIDNEAKLNWLKRAVQGDASETGLLKFIQPLLLKEYGGEYENGLDEIRQRHPEMLVGDEGEKNKALIPFSSEIKFNLIIRDMNEKIRQPSNA